MHVAGNYVSMFGNLHGSSGLIEQVSPDGYVGFDGGSGLVGTAFSTVAMPSTELLNTASCRPVAHLQRLRHFTVCPAPLRARRNNTRSFCHDDSRVTERHASLPR